MDTRTKIRKTALRLFSVRGFEAVSVRDISGAVGIKESSIYFHYKNKQDIFDHLLLDVHGCIEEMRAAFDRRFACIGAVTEDAFVAVALNLLHNFFRAEPIGMFIAMLSIERHVDEASALTYKQLVFDLPIKQQERVFSAMQEKGIFKRSDSLSLAREYHYAVYGVFMNGESDEVLAELVRRIYKREIME